MDVNKGLEEEVKEAVTNEAVTNEAVTNEAVLPPVKAGTERESIKELIVRRVMNLFTVKSIISLSLLFVFCYLVFNRYEVPETLNSTFGYVIAFFLGSQSVKVERSASK